ncbi:MAG: hypothetical protein ACTSRB_16910 [Candidatus Helarchaeota archaeon]
MGKSKIQQKKDIQEKEAEQKKQLIRKRYERSKDRVTEEEKREILRLEKDEQGSGIEKPSEMYTITFLMFVALIILPLPSLILSIIYSFILLEPLFTNELVYMAIRIILMTAFTYGFFFRLAKWGYYGMVGLSILGIILNLASLWAILAIFNIIWNLIGIGLNLFAFIILIGNPDTKEIFLKEKTI